MTNLKQLKKRINSIGSIQKITKAMQLVSATKISKAQDALAENSTVLALICKAYENAILQKQQNISKSTLKSQIFILITSNKGLCGSYNSSIIRNYKNMVSNLTETELDFSTILVGKKAKESIKDLQSIAYYDNIPEDYLELCDLIAEKIIEKIDDGVSVTICFNNYKNTTTYDHIFKCIWPIQQKKIEDIYPLKYEVSEIDVSSLRKLYFKICVLNALLSSNLSELSARMVAMDNATRNAKELTEKLTLNLNRSRQAMVTKELIEIISGAEAL
jgi:F-type H+-transporting ATPase subunit gamma